MDYNIETCIAELINYNPEENYVEPMDQMAILRQVFTLSEENNIYLKKMEEKVGLVFYVKFVIEGKNDTFDNLKEKLD